MVLNETFPSTPSAAIASYDSFDLSTNLAFKVFNAASNGMYILQPNTTESNDAWTQQTTSNTYEYNFDYTFNVPSILQGVCSITCTTDIVNAGATPSSSRTDWRVLKVDLASSETELIGTLTGDAVSVGSGSKSLRTTVSGTISRTQFKVGEKLRVEAQHVCTAGSGSPIFKLWHSPANRGTSSNDAITAEANNTNLLVTVPFIPIL